MQGGLSLTGYLFSNKNMCTKITHLMLNKGKIFHKLLVNCHACGFNCFAMIEGFNAVYDKYEEALFITNEAWFFASIFKG